MPSLSLTFLIGWKMFSENHELTIVRWVSTLIINLIKLNLPQTCPGNPRHTEKKRLQVQLVRNVNFTAVSLVMNVSLKLWCKCCEDKILYDSYFQSITKDNNLAIKRGDLLKLGHRLKGIWYQLGIFKIYISCNSVPVKIKGYRIMLCRGFEYIKSSRQQDCQYVVPIVFFLSAFCSAS